MLSVSVSCPLASVSKLGAKCWRSSTDYILKLVRRPDNTENNVKNVCCVAKAPQTRRLGGRRVFKLSSRCRGGARKGLLERNRTFWLHKVSIVAKEGGCWPRLSHVFIVLFWTSLADRGTVCGWLALLRCYKLLQRRGTEHIGYPWVRHSHIAAAGQSSVLVEVEVSFEMAMDRRGRHRVGLNT